jgi:hypothetical protein
MTQKQLIDFVEANHQKAKSIMMRKNDDYSHGEEDALRNFKTAELVRLEPDVMILANIVNKVSRLGNLRLKDPSVTEESEYDTAIDLINYVHLYLAMRHDLRTSKPDSK